jgi:hypothetical protein
MAKGLQRAEVVEAVPVDVMAILAELLARNRGPDPLDADRRRVPDYGVTASLEGKTLAMTLTFRKGAAYCCTQWGCHLGLIDGKRWDALRRGLAAHGVPAPPRLELQLSCVVEEGAVFFDFFRPDPTRRGWYAFEPIAARQYQASAVEAESPQGQGGGP